MLLLQAFDLRSDNNPWHLKSDSGSLSAGSSSNPPRDCSDEDGASAAAACQLRHGVPTQRERSSAAFSPLDAKQVCLGGCRPLWPPPWNWERFTQACAQHEIWQVSAKWLPLWSYMEMCKQTAVNLTVSWPQRQSLIPSCVQVLWSSSPEQFFCGNWKIITPLTIWGKHWGLIHCQLRWSL